MKNYTKKSIKESNGITLIALVITIIVLLILAGVSISMLSGDNGILRQATNAKILTGKANIVEQAKLDILGQIAENKGQNISKDQLKIILNKYFENIDSLEIPNDLSDSDIKLNANQTYGGYQNIALSEIYNGKFETAESGISYSIGDYVTINGEGFYVIEDSPINQTIVKLLAAKNINTITNKQSDEASKVKFDISTNVYANSSIKEFVDIYVTSLGVNVVNSRLLLFEDLFTLGFVYGQGTIYSDNCPSFMMDYNTFWLGEKFNEEDDEVWVMSGGWGEAFYVYEINYGIRPVIEILKSNIPNDINE